MTAISDLVSRLVVGQSTHVGALEVFPLFQLSDPSGNSPHLSTPYLLLADGLESGAVRVEEVSEGGSVPTLRLMNGSDLPVLAFDSEELVGAKQNRILAVSILAPANATIEIPVACVEQGRWRFNSRSFAPSKDMLFAKARAKKARSVRASYSFGDRPDAGQGEIWSAIDDKLERLKVQKQTAAMSEAFVDRSARVDDYGAAVGVQDGQIGAVFALNGRIFGLDVVERPDICAKLLPKLVRSYALEALEIEEIGEADAPKAVQFGIAQLGDFLKAVAAAETTTRPAVGLGEDVRFDGSEIEGGALVHGGQALHVSAFAAAEVV
jgi:hypothetical protein